MTDEGLQDFLSNFQSQDGCEHWNVSRGLRIGNRDILIVEDIKDIVTRYKKNWNDNKAFAIW